MRVRVKICGITSVADAERAVALGADAVGLNFYPHSPRCIDEATARQIIAVLPLFVEPVALFVDETLDHIEHAARRLGIRSVQIHGDVAKIKAPSGLLCIPAFPVRDAASLQTINAYLARTTSAGIIVDAHVPGMHGGTGQVAPWHLLADFKPSVPLILAGGLTPDNVAEAIRIVQPYAVDVASGVESSPGKKDADKMRRFIEAVRSAWPLAA